jgi:hypothetical protein
MSASLDGYIILVNIYIYSCMRPSSALWPCARAAVQRAPSSPHARRNPHPTKNDRDEPPEHDQRPRGVHALRRRRQQRARDGARRGGGRRRGRVQLVSAARVTPHSHPPLTALPLGLGCRSALASVPLTALPLGLGCRSALASVPLTALPLGLGCRSAAEKSSTP